MCLNSVPSQNAVADLRCAPSLFWVTCAHSTQHEEMFFGCQVVFWLIFLHFFLILTPLKPINMLIPQGFEEERQWQMWDLPGMLPPLVHIIISSYKAFKAVLGAINLLTMRQRVDSQITVPCSQSIYTQHLRCCSCGLGTQELTSV